MEPERRRIGGIPVRLLGPADPAAPLALWLPFLGGSAGVAEPALTALAEAGFRAASFDPWQHGERTDEAPEQTRDRALGAFRAEMWPILGHTTLEAQWLVDQLLTAWPDARSVVAGGYSMGGDVAVALAGIDHRVRRVAAIGSTPDWNRPGMHRLDGSGELVDQGVAGPAGQWLHDRLNPVDHLDRYTDVAIRFEHGGADDHVPVANAQRFAALLGEVNAAIVVHVTAGLDHVDSVRNPDALARSISWLRGR